ncbi:monocopper oxidase-like protein SKS1, partial [Asparagus officinalis]
MGDRCGSFLIFCSFIALFGSSTEAADIFLEWDVAFNWTIAPANTDQPVITVNGMFPGPLINATTNDNIFVNVFNNIDEPLLFTWNGIQQRLNSWQDGVSGTNCPIQPGNNWTYAFQVKDQIGSFFYFPSINFLKSAGGYGPLRVNNRIVIPVPFARPEGEFDLLIGDWYSYSYKEARGVV